MVKGFFISIIFSLLFFSCQKENIVEVNGIEVPKWLKDKIEFMEKDSYYLDAKAFRHEWKDRFIYHLEIPLSSCGFCEIYEQNGAKVDFANDSILVDYQKNRKNEVLIWERK